MKPLKQKRFWRTVLSMVIFLILALTTLLPEEEIEDVLGSLEQHQPGLYSVLEFSDGDTIIVDMNGTPERVRFIGVDTPEKNHPQKPVQCFAHAASEFTHNLIGANPVRLETDATNSNRDRYNRLLRYVYLPDGRLVNGEIIRAGYGFAYTAFPFEKSAEFQAYEAEAETANRGLWASCAIEVDDGQPQTSPAD